MSIILGGATNKLLKHNIYVFFFLLTWPTGQLGVRILNFSAAGQQVMTTSMFTCSETKFGSICKPVTVESCNSHSHASVLCKLYLPECVLLVVCD